MKPKVQRQEEALERSAQRLTRSPAEQLARLRKNGHGHCKEAKRLEEQLG